ncbi:MAG: FAD-dependent oxidoreductase [Comamonadaceae bacterium]|nr:MAG: FAD-dependent oxidoreductase [Comamonadaceae bacterium]
MTKRVIILGASVAGLGAALELRRCGFEGQIVLLDAQPHLPYDRPPLSKAILTGDATAESIRFHAESDYESAQIELRLATAVTSIYPASRSVSLATGEVLAADYIIIATGARARPFPASASCEGICTIRDLEDGLRLNEALKRSNTLAVIGGGFIGAEVASSARKLGVEVTIFEVDDLPFKRILGPVVAARWASLHHEAGVALKTGVRVQQVRRDSGTGFVLTLSDGTSHAADIVVAGLGAVPNTEFLDGSGLAIGDGVMCDSVGRTSHVGIYAAGDVANWEPVHGSLRARDEHWTSAREHARIVAHDICGQTGAPWSEYIPYFWSDMHGKRLQVLGTPQFADAVRIVFEDQAKGAFLAEYGCDGILVGVAGCNAAVRLNKYRAKLPSRPPFDETDTGTGVSI